MLNRVTIQGRLVADPELRQTPKGTTVSSVRVAVERDYKDKETGKRKADFFTVNAWRGTAEFLTKYFSKGQMVIIEGQLQNRSWEDKEGNKRISTEIVASNFYFADSKKSESTAPEEFPTEYTEVEDVENEDLPF